MTLTAADVAEIMRLVEQSGFDELTLEMDGVKLSLRRGGGALADHRSEAPAAPASPAPSGSASDTPAIRSATPAAQTSASPPVLAPAAPADPNVHDVAAPLLGTFYRAPKPGAPPFVEVGAHVEADTVVGIIEVMKLMNTVRAGVRGTVTEILSADGALAEYGESLMRVRKAG